MKNFRSVTSLIEGEAVMEGAGVRVRRLMGMATLPELDPFLLLDEFHSDNPDDYTAGFPPHPHRGFETVTYMLEGQSRHKDSAGHEGLLQPGDVQWMTAGRGIVHSEMPEQKDGRLWGYQLWVNLPAKLKMTEPRYQDIPSSDIPEIKIDDATVRVLAGRLRDVQGAADVHTPVLYLDVRLPVPGIVTLPVDENLQGFVYPWSGNITVASDEKQTVTCGRLAILDNGDALRVEVDTGAAFLLVAGKPLHEPVARGGPFVMNTEAEIQQAFRDYRSGKLGHIAG